MVSANRECWTHNIDQERVAGLRWGRSFVVLDR